VRDERVRDEAADLADQPDVLLGESVEHELHKVARVPIGGQPAFAQFDVERGVEGTGVPDQRVRDEILAGECKLIEAAVDGRLKVRHCSQAR